VSRETTIKIGPFRGINTETPPERCKPGHLQVARNVYPTDSGALRVRDGLEVVHRGAVEAIHSDGNAVLFREGASLRRYNPGTKTVETLASMRGAPRHTRYLTLNGHTYFTDRISTGVVDAGRARSWGLAPPVGLTVTPGRGDLPPGLYQVAATYMRSDGQESGSSKVYQVLVTEGGFSVSVPPSSDLDVVGANVYTSSAGGTMLYLTGLSYSVAFTGPKIRHYHQLKTALLSPPPAGSLLEFYGGRVYIASADVLWYTEPWRYELASMRHNFILMPGQIGMVAAVSNGLWVSTENETVFLAGVDPEVEGGLKIRTRIPVGAIPGAFTKVDGLEVVDGADTHGPMVVWAAKDGIYAGADAGAYWNLTRNVYAPGEAVEGAAGAQFQADARLLHFSILRSNLNGAVLRMSPPRVSGGHEE
jgi:hypothetical protein